METPGLSGAHLSQRSPCWPARTANVWSMAPPSPRILIGQGGAGLLPGARLEAASASFGAHLPAGIPMADELRYWADWIGRPTPASADQHVVRWLLCKRRGRASATARDRWSCHLWWPRRQRASQRRHPAFPATEPGVIGVTAVDSRAQPYADANRGDDVDFAAPGVRIWTPAPIATGKLSYWHLVRCALRDGCCRGATRGWCSAGSTAAKADSRPGRRSTWASRAGIRCSAGYLLICVFCSTATQ